MISPEKSTASFLPKPSKPQIIIPHRPERNYAELISKEPKTKIKNILRSYDSIPSTVKEAIMSKFKRKEK